MKEILILGALSALLFLSFIATLATGLAKNKKNLIFTSLTILSCFLGLASWTGYTFIKKSMGKVTNAFEPRTGAEIYQALFEPDESGCVRVTNSVDQIIPRIDPAIWLKFETCPAELKRILSRHPYNFEKIETASWMESIPYGEKIDWLNAREMGDTILVFEYATPSRRNIQTLWVSRDSTKVLCRDLLD